MHLHTGDVVYLSSEAERQEYVLNDNGLIFVGSASAIGQQVWMYGQVHTHSYTHSHAHTHTHVQHTHTSTHPHVRTHTHTHTHPPQVNNLEVSFAV